MLTVLRLAAREAERIKQPQRFFMEIVLSSAEIFIRTVSRGFPQIERAVSVSWDQVEEDVESGLNEGVLANAVIQLRDETQRAIEDLLAATRITTAPAHELRRGL